jgi:hypothetical protein
MLALRPRGRYRLDNLIARHGADTGASVILPELTERRDILFPERAYYLEWHMRQVLAP